MNIMRMEVKLKQRLVEGGGGCVAVIETEQNVSVYVVLADNKEVNSVVLPHFEANNKPFWFTKNYISFTTLPPR